MLNIFQFFFIIFYVILDLTKKVTHFLRLCKKCKNMYRKFK